MISSGSYQAKYKFSYYICEHILKYVIYMPSGTSPAQLTIKPEFLVKHNLGFYDNLLNYKLKYIGKYLTRKTLPAGKPIYKFLKFQYLFWLLYNI